MKKAIFWIVVAVAVVAIAGGIYEKISMDRLNADYEREVERYRADNVRLRGELAKAGTEIGNLTVDIKKLEQKNSDLGVSLATSAELVEGLRDANRRLAESITVGLEAAGGAGEDSARIEGALREALGIIDQIKRDNRRE